MEGSPLRDVSIFALCFVMRSSDILLITLRWKQGLRKASNGYYEKTGDDFYSFQTSATLNEMTT